MIRRAALLGGVAAAALGLSAMGARANVVTCDNCVDQLTNFGQFMSIIRADAERIDGMLRGPATLGAMLDLAAARGWTEVAIRGDREVAREAWIEATARGLRAEGYAPSRDDLHAAEQRRVEREAQRVAPPAPPAPDDDRAEGRRHRRHEMPKLRR